MVKRITALCVILIVLIILPGFYKPSGASETKVLTDSLGRQVTAPEKVERIACMYAFTAHVTAMLGRADDIVAVSNGPQRDILLTNMFPSIRKALVPKYQGAINVEELARAKPDIVFVAADTGRNEAEAAKLDACGLTWIAVDFHTMDAQQQTITLIGNAIGAPKKARAYNQYYRTCIEQARNAVKSMPDNKRVKVYHATVEPTRTSPRESLSADCLQTAGVINVAVQDETRFIDGQHQVAMEQILLWNPELILVNEPGAAAFIKKSPKWSAIAAVQQGKVYQMPIGISRWGHPGSLETPLAVLWTVKTVYPDKLTEVDMNREVRHFYKAFFNYDLSDDMIEHILSGKGMRLTKDKKKKQ